MDKSVFSLLLRHLGDISRKLTFIIFCINIGVPRFPVVTLGRQFPLSCAEISLTHWSSSCLIVSSRSLVTIRSSMPYSPLHVVLSMNIADVYILIWQMLPSVCNIFVHQHIDLKGHLANIMLFVVFGE